MSSIYTGHDISRQLSHLIPRISMPFVPIQAGRIRVWTKGVEVGDAIPARNMALRVLGGNVAICGN